jgi:hypothetical protein
MIKEAEIKVGLNKEIEELSKLLKGKKDKILGVVSKKI